MRNGVQRRAHEPWIPVSDQRTVKQYRGTQIQGKTYGLVECDPRYLILLTAFLYVQRLGWVFVPSMPAYQRHGACVNS